MEVQERVKKIKGWGSDLDPSSRPAYPKERTPERFAKPHWDQPEQQTQKIPIFHSIERPGITPVFGTSTPPSGLSGQIRKLAYKLSESDIRHWYLLVAADRVNMVEGIFEDLRKGHIPNIFAEMGIKAELKYNKKGLVKKSLIAAGALGLVALYLQNRLQGKLAGSEHYDELGY